MIARLLAWWRGRRPVPVVGVGAAATHPLPAMTVTPLLQTECPCCNWMEATATPHTRCLYCERAECEPGLYGWCYRVSAQLLLDADVDTTGGRDVRWDAAVHLGLHIPAGRRA